MRFWRDTCIAVAIGMFVALVAVLAGKSVGVILALGVVAFVVAAIGLTLWERRRDREQVIAQSDPEKSLLVAITNERFHPFQYKALIGEIEVTATNRSRGQLDLKGFAFTKADPYEFALDADVEVQAEVRRLKAPRQSIAGLLDPKKSTVGYMVYAFPHMPQGGRTGYEIYVEDVVGDRYGVVVPRRSPRHFVRSARI